MTKKGTALMAGCESIRGIMRGYVEPFIDIIEADGEKAPEVLNSIDNNILVIFVGFTDEYDSGTAFVRYLNDSGIIRRIPVIVFSQKPDKKLERFAYEMGAAECISFPFDSENISIKLRNTVTLYMYKDELEDRSEKYVRQTVDNHHNTIDFLANVIEARNLENGEHVSRVKGFTRILAEQVMKDYPSFGLNESQVDLISAASALHDLGKIMIRESVLLKPDTLTENEMLYMRTHTLYGCELLNKMRNMLFDAFFHTSYDICRYHHERDDGSGYPDGLVGDDIPLSARIVSIADCFDALTAKRPYKEAYSSDRAYDMILSGECGAFSEKILESFKRCKPAMVALAEELAPKK